MRPHLCRGLRQSRLRQRRRDGPHHHLCGAILLIELGDVPLVFRLNLTDIDILGLSQQRPPGRCPTAASTGELPHLGKEVEYQVL